MPLPNKPAPGASNGTWGSELNAYLAAIETTKAEKSLPASVSTAAALPGRFDPNLHLYNAKPSQLAKLRAKLAAAYAGTGTAKIAHAGDSITLGLNTTKHTQSWPARVREALTANGYPSGGSGFNTMTFDTRWTFQSGWTLYQAAKFIYQCTTAGATATYVSTDPGTTVTVYYRNTNGFTVAIDGGAPVAVPSSSSGTLKTYQVTGLADTTHTVVITATVSFVYILGVEVSRTTGVRVANFGLSGSQSGMWNVADYDGPMATVGTWLPDFVTLALGTNDQRTGPVPVATYKTNMQALITTAKGWSSAPDVALIAMPPNSSGTAVVAPYIDALYELADSNDLPLLDFSDRFVSYTSANALGMMFDATHPNAVGQFDLGRTVLAGLYGIRR